MGGGGEIKSVREKVRELGKKKERKRILDTVREKR